MFAFLTQPDYSQGLDLFAFEWMEISGFQVQLINFKPSWLGNLNSLICGSNNDWKMIASRQDVSISAYWESAKESYLSEESGNSYACSIWIYSFILTDTAFHTQVYSWSPDLSEALFRSKYPNLALTFWSWARRSRHSNCRQYKSDQLKFATIVICHIFQ